jgi:RimJ/RimL family protein N-acetyltransferase
MDDSALGERTIELHTERLLLRRWRESDREPFAGMNADPEVMRYFRAPLDRDASDALIDRAEAGFDEHDYGLWAVEVRATGSFIGFIGLALQTFEATFNPSVEVGWRLSRDAWGHGFATEGARASLAHGFGPVGLDEIVSMTTRTNLRSQAVMQRLGMSTDPADDFEHPRLPEDHPLRPHVLYRISRDAWLASGDG